MRIEIHDEDSNIPRVVFLSDDGQSLFEAIVNDDQRSLTLRSLRQQVGIVTALLGGPVFIWIVRRQSRSTLPLFRANGPQDKSFATSLISNRCMLIA